jgi:hypothetical protein
VVNVEDFFADMPIIGYARCEALFLPLNYERGKHRGERMTIESSVLSWDGKRWVRDEVLLPELNALKSSGGFTPPARFNSDEDAIEALADLFDAQMILIETGKRQTMDALARATNSSGPQVQTLLAAVEDWDALAYGLRFRPSNRGAVGLDESVFVIKSEPWLSNGPSVFAACSPAFPKDVVGILEHYGVDTGSRRPQDSAFDSTVYLVECNPELGGLVLAVAPLPEGTQWDCRDEDRYPPELLGDEGLLEVKEALEATAGYEYEVSTSAILDASIFGPLRTAIADHDCSPRAPMPIESGWISFGEEGNRHHFLGGELGVIHALRKAGFAPFFDVPRNLSAGFPGAAPLSCTFKLRDGRVMPGEFLFWAARSTFGMCPPPPDFKGVFRPVADATLEMAGADPANVEYASTNARIGKRDAPRRFRAGLLARNDAGTLTIWGVPGKEFGAGDDDVTLRTAIAQAEQSVLRMKPEGTVQATVERMQDAGLQRTGVKLFMQRRRREGFLCAADILRARAIRGI